MKERRLTRDTAHGLLGGVCAGLANYFGWGIASTRFFYVLLSVLSAGFPGTLVYILLWIFMPKR